MIAVHHKFISYDVTTLSQQIHPSRLKFLGHAKFHGGVSVAIKEGDRVTLAYLDDEDVDSGLTTELLGVVAMQLTSNEYLISFLGFTGVFPVDQLRSQIS